MIFSQTYPIVTYVLMLTILTAISFLLVLSKRRQKKVLVVAPNFLWRKIAPSFTNGIPRSVEIFNEAGKIPLKMYKSCVFILNPKEDLEKQIESYKRIKEQAEDSVAILVSERLDGVSFLKQKIPEVRIFKLSEIEKIREIIYTQIRKV